MVHVTVSISNQILTLHSNIGNAKIDGLTEDLHLTGDKFNIALTVFYVPYM